MFYIHCPHCNEWREEEEFHPKGQAHIQRPEDPAQCSDEAWGDYLFFRDNPRGIHHELWVHAVGCRKFFNMTRHTQTYEILETYRIGEAPRFTQANPDGKTAPADAGDDGQGGAGRATSQLSSHASSHDASHDSSYTREVRA
ncbi:MULTISPECIES: sarcosine oxidase subunit delta [Halomonas]|uniref:sarcosine oxidase subunit delta n=1 Tax=Halomonas TaxID=2745 RepID=UPI001C968050|nr:MULTISPECIES: sarcosine oxidase subunit delta [Halomonas]MED5297279.1 sarcosine oxidase subunit delta [Pseudomonadota bacterium]MBY5924546.1 sarcosine oxidase subunit delta [Halomonas sp. DP4Y7-2]MBY6207688.1 sarcosine oxidase subunit delta [Halomonas sp. DP3Y7-2]MBY6228497.1 sarcosine oxidase subunit delta [Halomonas sp. DP3Y7-1]MBY6231588.1 sarcosine oxidase subunit delta [Halomonas sp. DP4Y7-1]